MEQWLTAEEPETERLDFRTFQHRADKRLRSDYHILLHSGMRHMVFIAVPAVEVAIQRRVYMQNEIVRIIVGLLDAFFE